MDQKTLTNRGQVAVFIIVGIVIVVGVIVFAYFAFNGGPSLIASSSDDPSTFISTCVRDAIRETVDVMMPHGGLVEPTDYKLYNKTKVAYVCKNINYYQPCINQYPRYITSVKEELEHATQERVLECFEALEGDLREKEYEVETEEMDYAIDLKPGIISATIHKDLVITKDGNTQAFSTFSTVLTSPLYDMASVTSEIISQEARFCNFETLGFSILYPTFDIRRDLLSDSTKIYTIAHVKTQKKMNIAIRGCAIPAGF